MVWRIFLPNQFENIILGRVFFSTVDEVCLPFCIVGNDLPPSSEIFHGIGKFVRGKEQVNVF